MVSHASIHGLNECCPDLMACPWSGVPLVISRPTERLLEAPLLSQLGRYTAVCCDVDMELDELYAVWMVNCNSGVRRSL